MHLIVSHYMIMINRNSLIMQNFSNYGKRTSEQWVILLVYYIVHPSPLAYSCTESTCADESWWLLWINHLLSWVFKTISKNGESYVNFFPVFSVCHHNKSRTHFHIDYSHWLKHWKVATLNSDIKRAVCPSLVRRKEKGEKSSKPTFPPKLTTQIFWKKEGDNVNFWAPNSC